MDLQINHAEWVPAAEAYAKALFEIACDCDCLDATWRSLQRLEDLLRTTPELARFLYHASTLSEARITELLDPLFNQIEPYLLKTLRLMIAQEHAPAILAMYHCFQVHYEARKGIGHIHITTAIPLHADALEALKQRLIPLFNLEEAVLHPVCDPAVLGGIYVEYQGLRFDATLQRKLKQLESQLLIV